MPAESLIAILQPLQVVGVNTDGFFGISSQCQIGMDRLRGRLQQDVGNITDRDIGNGSCGAGFDVSVDAGFVVVSGHFENVECFKLVLLLQKWWRKRGWVLAPGCYQLFDELAMR